ncbi:hypothetical protein Q4Q35_17745 [Flavivirga aquimarina]|uniref:Uncharacterized protein n=1 Tax=Flavivirga aquimarina TaxID=2027862 RepID=A0ABT8WER3_9FLAO|nr:hypothetical protein [Flavivirga aquimarina]MDO5971650.1 hypothetical protein [Flavivirga aquimarina]
MKKILFIVSLISLCYSCKQKEEKALVVTETSIAEKIANAHGFEHWKNVSEITFTFGGKRNWTWNPKTNDITLITKKDTIHYNRKTIDSTSQKADRGFINDKFWLLIPFQLVWDTSAGISDPIKTEAPISKTEMNKITITYSKKGGYTPGDAYDIYFDKDYIIREWAFRKGNKAKAGLINTFENYQDYNGIKLALGHTKQAGNQGVKFTNVKVTFQ